MLQYLKISNVAVISETEVSFHSGFNVLTGETGAGKSLIIDAINFILGQRSTRDLIRSGEDRAFVQAIITVDAPQVLTYLEQAGITPEEDGSLLVSRELRSDGKNLCRVNGSLVTVGQLKDMGRLLINIHGQQDSQSLLQRELHISFLDKFARLAPEVSAYREQYQALRMVQKKIAALSQSEADEQKRLDLLAFQVQEIEDAALLEGEEEALLSERDVLSGAQELSDLTQKAHFLLSAAEPSATELLDTALKAVTDACAIDESLSPMADALADCLYQVKDLSQEAKTYSENAVFDEARLAEIEDRLDVISRMKRKYGQTVSQVLAFYESARAELSAIENHDQVLEELKSAEKALNKKVEQLAAALTQKRHKAAQDMEKQVHSELADLEMAKVRFSVQFAQKPPGKNGADEVEFFISTNPMEPPKPLAKIASGGEMSRIMLALKSVLAGTEAVNTLIFDEIDTGVSGRAAQKMAQKLRALAKTYQVLCITHLPQLAAMANYQYLIEKNTATDRFSTRVCLLDDAQREAEIARLISGDTITEAALKTARELIAADNRK